MSKSEDKRKTIICIILAIILIAIIISIIIVVNKGKEETQDNQMNNAETQQSTNQPQDTITVNENATVIDSTEYNANDVLGDSTNIEVVPERSEPVEVTVIEAEERTIE